MFAKAKARVRQFAGMDQVTCVDPVMDARFNRFQGMEKGLSTVYDAMGAYFAAHKALSRASTELSTALEAYHMDAIKAYSENELDNAVESSDACDPVASEARTSATHGRARERAPAAGRGEDNGARTASPLLRPVVLYVKRTRCTWMGAPGAAENHCATSWSVAVKGRPRSRT